MKLIFTLTFMVALSISFGQVTTFDYTGSIETYTVPDGVSRISIQAYGAQGGNDNGGLGAGIYGEFDVTAGNVLNIVVGQQGIVNNCGGADASGGGGGGSFVWDADDAALPWIAAGAGGGGNENWGGIDCRDGLPGQAGEDGTSGAEGLAAGGIGGEGGAGDAPSGTGSGGGGWLSAGQNSTWGDGCTGGETLPTFAGGNGASGFGPGGEGGFGGGGGSVCGCGGGGGYSGGAGGNGSSCRAGGGGGGSYNQGEAQVNETGVRSGDGQIIITELCNPLTVTVSDTEICLGEEVTISGTSESGDAVTWDMGVEDGVAFVPESTGENVYTGSTGNDEDCGATVSIMVYELPETFATTTPDNDGIGIGEIDLIVTGGAPAYLFDWDNDGTGDFDDMEDLTGLTTGTYVVVVRDANDCESVSDSYFVSDLASLNTNESSNIKVYPNPTVDLVNVQLPGDFDYQLISLKGEVLLNGKSNNAVILDIESFESGVYYLRLITESENTLIELIKQ